MGEDAEKSQSPGESSGVRDDPAREAEQGAVTATKSGAKTWKQTSRYNPRRALRLIMQIGMHSWILLSGLVAAGCLVDGDNNIDQSKNETIINPAEDLCKDGVCPPKDNKDPNCGWQVKTDATGAAMCEVPAGTFKMGCNAVDPGCSSESQPQVAVEFARKFYIDRNEVSNAAYKVYLNATKSQESVPSCDEDQGVWDSKTRTFESKWDEHPVVCVTAMQAQKYCEWAGKRLPTEAEWEAAARGLEGNHFPWGANFNTDTAQCFHDWSAYDPASQCANTYAAGTCPGAKSPITCNQTAPGQINGNFTLEAGRSPFGALHMAGNAAEWVAEVWSEDHQKCVDSCKDPSTSPSASDNWVVKGGSWSSRPDDIASWGRQSASGGTANSRTGFRCAR